MENTVTKKNINKNWIEIIILISLFNFLFLGSEYLFDNMIAKVANPSKVVIAVSYTHLDVYKRQGYCKGKLQILRQIIKTAN